jgi:putative tryptophan/tyrosine transport system substrate-binding protein
MSRPKSHRRQFLTGLGATALASIAPLRRASPQMTRRKRRIGVLTWWPEDDPAGRTQTAALAEGLAALGWVDGNNIQIEYRRGSGEPGRMSWLAKDLVAQRPDVLLGIATPAVTALLAETDTIPVVFTEVSDPVGPGFVESVARPGRNATGFVDIEASLAGKWVEMLKEVVPSMTRVGFLFNPKTAPENGSYYMRAFQEAARALALEPVTAAVANPAELGAKVATLAAQGYIGLILMPDSFVLTQRRLIIAQIAQQALPAIYPFRFFATAGGLMSYGANLAIQNRQAAGYTDRILKGEKPANLPVQLPTQFELVINLNTAKALGVTMPQNLLANANFVIE